MTFLLHTYRLMWSTTQDTAITYHSVGDHVASSARQYIMTPSILDDDTPIPCVYLGETLSCPRILAWDVPVWQSQVRRRCQIMDWRRQRYAMLLVPRLLEVSRRWAWLYLLSLTVSSVSRLKDSPFRKTDHISIFLQESGSRIHTCVVAASRTYATVLPRN